MEVGEYCSKVCNAKCCYFRIVDEGAPFRCPCLKGDNTCACYQERYEGPNADKDIVVVGYFKSRRYQNLDGTPASRPLYCGKILKIHASGGLPKDIADQCCVIYPHLLKGTSNESTN